MMCDDTTNRKSPSTKMLTITTPDIINGQIKSIKVKNEKYHDVNLKFLQTVHDTMEIDENPTPMGDTTTSRATTKPIDKR